MIGPLFPATPKWQNPKSQKRIEALSELDLSLEQNIEILLKLARDDSDATVRSEAVKLLPDLDALSQIHEHDPDASVRDNASQRLNDLLAGKTANPLPLVQRHERLQQVTDPQTLLHIVREADEIELRLAALAKISDENQLEDIARHSSIARLRLAAVERIHTPALLEALADVLRQKDKNVYKAIRQRLDQQASVEKQAQALQEKREALCRNMENHAHSVLSPLYAAKTESLRQQWQELGDAVPEMAARFDAAFAVAHKQVSDHAAVLQREADQAHARNEIRQCVQTLENALASYQGQDDFDAATLSAQLETQRQRWEQATPLHAAPDDLANRYQKVTARLEQLESLLRQWQQDAPTVATTLARLDETENGAENEEHTTLVQTLIALRDHYLGYGLPLPVMLRCIPALPVVTVAPAKAANIPDPALRQKLDERLRQTAAAVEAGHSHQAERHLRKAQDFARTHHLHDARLNEWRERLLELKSWAGYAVQPKKEDLIARMQALITHDMDPDDKADAIHSLQEEWKALGVADPHVEKPLWDQFKAAGDQAFEPCRQHFAAQRELRQRNLEKRRALYEQLQAYHDALPAPMDWKRHEAILRQARQEWQQSSPSDRQKTRSLQERFQSLLKALEQLANEERRRNEGQKRVLIERVTALTSMADLRTACDQAKQLQQEWKDIGPATTKVDHRLWLEFRAACDTLFNQREAEFKVRQDARQQQVQEAESLIAAFTALADSGHSGHEAEAAALDEKFRALSLPREKSKALNDRFYAQRQRLEQSRRSEQDKKRQEKREARVQAWATRAVDNGPDSARAQVLLLDLEILLDLPSPDAEQRRQRQMQRLQERGLRRADANETDKLLTELLQTTVTPDDVSVLSDRLRVVLRKTA